MADDDLPPDVKRLPVRFKEPPSGAHLRIVEGYGPDAGCNHRWVYRDNRMQDVQYWIRDGEAEVECSECHAKLDPMWVLTQIAREESRWNETRLRYDEEMKRLRERSRTKCVHCGKLTRISSS